MCSMMGVRPFVPGIDLVVNGEFGVLSLCNDVRVCVVRVGHPAGVASGRDGPR